MVTLFDYSTLPETDPRRLAMESVSRAGLVPMPPEDIARVREAVLRHFDALMPADVTPVAPFPSP